MQSGQLRQLIAAGLLGCFAMLGTGLVAVTHEYTHERIVENQRQLQMRQLGQLIPLQHVDNDLLTDVITISAPQTLNAETTMVYRARRDGQNIAAVFSPVVAHGYAGSIHLIVAVQHNGTLAGVRVLQHRETPGLGDRVEVERSDWIYSFNHRALDAPGPEGWRIKRDGGVFDQFTGASITPRGVVNAVYATLKYYAANRDRLFAKPSEEQLI